MSNQSRLLRRTEVTTRTGLGRTSIYRGIANGSFPKPVQIGPRSVAWREQDVSAWIESRTEGTRPAVTPRRVA